MFMEKNAKYCQAVKFFSALFIDSMQSYSD